MRLLVRLVTAAVEAAALVAVVSVLVGLVFGDGPAFWREDGWRWSVAMAAFLTPGIMSRNRDDGSIRSYRR